MAPSIHAQPCQAQGNRKGSYSQLLQELGAGLWALAAGLCSAVCKGVRTPAALGTRWDRSLPRNRGNCGHEDLNHGQGGNRGQGEAAQGREKSAGTWKKGG